MSQSKLPGVIGIIALVGVGWLGAKLLFLDAGSEVNTRTASIGANSGDPTIAVSEQETTICRTLEDANARFRPLAEQWSAATHSGDKNEIRKQLALDQIKREIDDTFHTRNSSVLSVLGGRDPQAKNWAIRITKLSSIERTFSSGAHRYLTLEGMLTCHLPVAVTIDDILETPEVVKFVATLNIGEYIIVSGRLVLHDAEANPLDVAVEWGGPLWGPFGGLWNDAFERPAYRLALEHWSRS